MGDVRSSAPLPSSGGDVGGSKPSSRSDSGLAWILGSIVVGAVVGVLTGFTILVAVRHLFDVLGQGGLPSQDKAFQSAAALGGLAAAIAVAAILIAIGLLRQAREYA